MCAHRAGQLHRSRQPHLKRAGGGFDASHNAQTVVDEQARIIVAAELVNNAADVGQIVPMLDAVKDNTG